MTITDRGRWLAAGLCSPPTPVRVDQNARAAARGSGFLLGNLWRFVVASGREGSKDNVAGLAVGVFLTLSIPFTNIAAATTDSGPLAAVGIAGRDAGLVGIEIGFDGAVERGELGVEDAAPEQGAHPPQLQACPPTRRQHFHANPLLVLSTRLGIYSSVARRGQGG